MEVPGQEGSEGEAVKYLLDVLDEALLLGYMIMTWLQFRKD